MPVKKTRTTVPRTRAEAAERTTRPSDREIAARAYEIFVERGGEHGHDIEDWLLAQRQLSAGA